MDTVPIVDIVDGSGVVKGDPLKRRIVLTPELKKELKERCNRTATIPKEQFTGKWFNRGMEGGSPPTAAKFQKVGLSRLFSIAQDSFNRGSATNVIVQNASLLAQSIISALLGVANAGNQQIITNVIVQDAPALVQQILAALPGANGGNQQPNGGNQQIITNVIVQNAPALAQLVLSALLGANGGNQQPNASSNLTSD